MRYKIKRESQGERYGMSKPKDSQEWQGLPPRRQSYPGLFMQKMRQTIQRTHRNPNVKAESPSTFRPFLTDHLLFVQRPLPPNEKPGNYNPLGCPFCHNTLGYAGICSGINIGLRFNYFVGLKNVFSSVPKVCIFPISNLTKAVLS